MEVVITGLCHHLVKLAMRCVFFVDFHHFLEVGGLALFGESLNLVAVMNALGVGSGFTLLQHFHIFLVDAIGAVLFFILVLGLILEKFD